VKILDINRGKWLIGFDMFTVGVVSFRGNENEILTEIGFLMAVNRLDAVNIFDLLNLAIQN
jgi:hypothetical protein